MRMLAAALVAANTVALAANYGLQAGAKLPAFSLPDQNGTTRTLKDIVGPKGAAIVFFRSADW